MNRQLYQMNQFQPAQSSNIESTVFNSYFTCDLNLSDTTSNDLFSEFDVNTNNFQCFDGSTNEINYSPYNNTLHPVEQYENQQSNIELSLSSPPDHHEPTTNSSPSPLLSVQFPQLIINPPPISVTFDQFQALISATRDTSKTNYNTTSRLLENTTIIGHNIPMKIVHQTSSDEFYEPHSLMNNHNQSMSRNENNTHRKSTHNAIEKRYRSSINERIHQLKEIVAASDGKIQKSGILQRTIEYIRQLQSINHRLNEENNTLKIHLRQFNLTHDDLSSNNHVRSTKKRNTRTSTSNGHSIEGKKRTKSKRGMGDGSRLVLCCFMLCILLINPFNYLLDHFHLSDDVDTNEVQSRISSRTLQSTADYGNGNFLSKHLIVWLLNITVCLVCMVKLIVYGEVIVHQSDMDEYYFYKKKADQLLNENRFNEAYLSYQKCCEKLYISIDQTYFYYFTSIPWQISRLCLNLIYLGRWLTYWTNSIDTNRELNHCFLQLWKIEYHYSRSFLNLINLFLLTINTGKKLDQNKRNEMCLLTALTLQKYNRLLSLFILYVLKYLRPIHVNDSWLLEIDRLHKFLLKTNVDVFKDQSFIESIRIQYFQYILYENIRHQILFQEEQEPKFLIQNDNELDRYTWWQHTLQVIRCISSNKQTILLNQTIYHQIRTKQFIDKRYITIIEIIHNILLVLTDDNYQTSIKLLEQLGQSSRILIKIIEINNEDNFELAIKTLLLDGILSLRLRLLTNLMTNDQENIPFLDDFQQELEQYKQLNHLMKLPKQRYYLFESIFRISSGLNPLTTETLFEHAIKQSNSLVQINAKSSVNLDIIAALLLFCHFSPSTIYRYQNILQQVVLTSLETNQNHDFNRLQKQCLTLIQQSYLTF